MKQLLDLIRIKPCNSCLFIYKSFADHVHGDLYSRLSSSLTVSGLKHIELVSLNSELHVLHILVVLFKKLCNANEFLIAFREGFLHFVNVKRRSHTCHNVFPLGVYKELTEYFIFPCRRISGKGNSCSGGVSHISENHGLNIYCRTKVSRNSVKLSVKNSPVVVP